MRGVHSLCGLVAAMGIVAARDARAGDCIPKDASLDLGAVAGAPVLCSLDTSDAHRGVAACWDVDVATGAVHARAAAALPGHSITVGLVKGCALGYCDATADKGATDVQVSFAVSTDGAHVVMSTVDQSAKPLLVFDAASKKLVRTIPLAAEDAPEATNVSNMVGQIVYVGNTIYVLGQDAGPFAAVWAYKDDGTRLGAVSESAKPRTQDERDTPLNVSEGGLTVLDDHHVGVATSSLETLTILDTISGKRVERTRKVGRGPCKRAELDDPGAEPRPKCAAYLAKHYRPYAGAALISLPDGKFLAALGGDAAGALVTLDAKRLTEKKRVTLPFCAP